MTDELRVRMGREQPWICLVTDRRRLTPGARTTREALLHLERLLDEAIRAGVDLIQIRERDLEAADLVRLTRAVRARAEGTGTRVLVNDRADVARATGADGVHLRADSAAVPRVRELEPSWIIGRSIHGVADLLSAGGADYVMFGPVFATASKPDASPAGLDRLANVVQATSTPVLAIGGMTPLGAAKAFAAGAAGVAAIGLFLPPGSSPDALGPVRGVAELRRAC